MKNSLLLLVIIIQLNCFAQKVKKVDLDSYPFEVKYQRLPAKYVSLEKKLYSTEVNLSPEFIKHYPNKLELSKSIQIFGWKETVGLANVDVIINLNNVEAQAPKLESRIVESKSKDGVVTKKTLYNMVAMVAANSVVVIRIKGAISDSGTDEEMRIPFKSEYKYNSPYEYENQQTVKDLYEKDKNGFYVESIKKHVAEVFSDTYQRVNSTYGLQPITHTDNLWIIDSKEEEGAIQKEAIEAVKVIFSKMTITDPIDNILIEMQPLIEYFESLKTKYAEDDKSSKKIRYSAYYNLGKIYLHLDQPEKAITEGEGLIKNDYDKKDGTKIIEDATYDLKAFKNTAYKSKHNPILY